MANTHPRLLHIANPWSLVDYPPGRKEWSLARKLRAIKEAGFDGFATNLTPEHARWAEKLELYVMGFFSAGTVKDLTAAFRRQRDAGARHVNVQLADHDTPVKKATQLAIRCVEIGRSMGLEPSIEVHRDTCTETPEKAYAIADGYRKATGELMPITWDFSHLAVVKHLRPSDFAARLLERPELVRRARQFHLRPFNGHHCQVPVTDGTGRFTPELEAWTPFAEEVLRLWLKGNRESGGELFVVPEMGPTRSGYNLSAFPNSWDEAVTLREVLDRLWKRAQRR